MKLEQFKAKCCVAVLLAWNNGDRKTQSAPTRDVV